MSHLQRHSDVPAPVCRREREECLPEEDPLAHQPAVLHRQVQVAGGRTPVVLTAAGGGQDQVEGLVEPAIEIRINGMGRMWQIQDSFALHNVLRRRCRAPKKVAARSIKEGIFPCLAIPLFPSPYPLS